MASFSPENRLHRLLFQHVEKSLKETDVAQFINITVGTYLEAGVVSRCNGNMFELLNELETNGVIGMGNYNKLMHILLDAKLLKLYREVRFKADEISETLKLAPLTSPVSDVKQDTTEDVRIYRDYKMEQLREKSASWLKVCKTKQTGFICTSVYQDVLRAIRNNSSLLIVGNPGEGKSSILQQVALEFIKDGYFILFVNSPKEIEEHFLHDRKILFIFDDPFGEGCCQRKVEKWTHLRELYFQRIFRASQIKLLIGCSSSVWSECIKSLENLSVFKNKLNICSSNLTVKEKVDILRHHLPETIDMSEETLRLVCSVKTLSFMNSCKSLISAGMEFKDNADLLSHFFNSVEDKQKLLNSLSHAESGRLPYVMLVTVMLNGGYLPCDMTRLTSNQRSMLKCLVSSNDNEIIQIVSKSSENIVRVFLYKTMLDRETFYMFKDDGLLVMVLTHFARKNPTQFMHWCEPSLISHINIGQGCGTNDKRTLDIPQDIKSSFVQLIIKYVSEDNYTSMPLFPDDIQSEVINCLSNNDNVLSRLIDNDTEDYGNFFYHSIKARIDKVAVFLCRRRAKCSRFFRFHPIVALSSAGRHAEIALLLDMLSYGRLQFCGGKETLLNNNTTKQIQYGCIKSVSCDQFRELDNNADKNNGGHRHELLECILEFCHSNLPVVLGHALIQGVAEKQTNVVETLLKYTTVTATFDMALSEAFCLANNAKQTNLAKEVLLLNLTAATRTETLVEVVRKGDFGLTELILETGSSSNAINLALLEASRFNHKNLIALLMRYNPSVESIRKAFLSAKHNRHEDILGELLKFLSEQDVNNSLDQSFVVCNPISSQVSDILPEFMHFSRYETNPNHAIWNLKQAVVLGDIETVKQIVQFNVPIEETSQVIERLARTGHMELLTLLLPDIAPTESFQTAYISAAWGGHLDVLKTIPTSRIFRGTLSLAVREASRRNQLSVVDYLMGFTMDQDTVEEALYEAVWMGNLSILQLIISKTESILSPKVVKRLLEVGVKRTHHHIVNFLLPRCVDLAVISMILTSSIESGHRDFTSQYLRFVPDGCELGTVLEVATWQGQITLLEELQQKAKVSPVHLGNAIYIATVMDDLEALVLLLNFEGVENALVDSFPSVIRSGNTRLVTILLSRDLPQHALMKGLYSATVSSNTTLVHLMLPKIQSPEVKRAAVLSAASRGDIDVLKLLVCDVPRDILEEAMLRASWSGKLSSIEYLTKCLPEAAVPKEAINVARIRRHSHVLCVLLEANLVPLTTHPDYLEM